MCAEQFEARFTKYGMEINVRQILQQLSAKWTQHENKPHPLIISTITNCGILRPATAAAESVDRLALAHPSQRSC